MTGANRLPAQPTTRGKRCQCVPTPAEAARWASKLPFFATTRLFEPVAGRKSTCGVSNSTGERYYGARMARRRSRANGIWEMSVNDRKCDSRWGCVGPPGKGGFWLPPTPNYAMIELIDLEESIERLKYANPRTQNFSDEYSLGPFRGRVSTRASPRTGVSFVACGWSLFVGYLGLGPWCSVNGPTEICQRRPVVGNAFTIRCGRRGGWCHVQRHRGF
jgi:hypothetical protein